VARQAAAERLAAAAFPAAAVLFDIIDMWKRDICAVCGMPKGDPSPVIRAAQIVLDRTGFHPTIAVEHKAVSGIPAWAKYVTQEEYAQIQTIIEGAKARVEAGERAPEYKAPPPDLTVEAEDGVLIDIDEDPELPPVPLPGDVDPLKLNPQVGSTIEEPK
jgi:hypothetical protein